MNPRLRIALRSPRPAAGESDERLAQLARLGDSAAFDALIARHRRGLVADCARVLGPADAEEAVQEALIRAHVQLSAGQVVHAPGPWLRVIARHTALNMLRARAARPSLCDGDPELVAVDVDEPERRRRLSELVDAVAELPERQRHAIVMRELEGRSYEEIGLRLGASDGAVRQLLSRARSALRARLGTVAGFEPLIRIGLGGGGLGVARLGALSGAGVLTFKLGSAALFPTLALSPPAAQVARHQGHAIQIAARRSHPAGLAAGARGTSAAAITAVAVVYRTSAPPVTATYSFVAAPVRATGAPAGVTRTHRAADPRSGGGATRPTSGGAGGSSGGAGASSGGATGSNGSSTGARTCASATHTTSQAATAPVNPTFSTDQRQAAQPSAQPAAARPSAASPTADAPATQSDPQGPAGR